jgi:glucuronate isomerase
VLSFKNLLPQNNWANFNQTWHKSSLEEGDSSLFKRLGLSFSKGGDNSKRVKNTLKILKNLLLQNQQAKFNQTLYKLSLSERNSSSNKGPGPFQGGDNHKNVKMGWCHLKIFFSRTTGLILPDLAQIILGERGFNFFLQMIGIVPLQEEVIAKE